MVCKHCGCENLEGTTICVFCGEPMEKPDQSISRIMSAFAGEAVPDAIAMAEAESGEAGEGTVQIVSSLPRLRRTEMGQDVPYTEGENRAALAEARALMHGAPGTTDAPDSDLSEQAARIVEQAVERIVSGRADTGDEENTAETGDPFAIAEAEASVAEAAPEEKPEEQPRRRPPVVVPPSPLNFSMEESPAEEEEKDSGFGDPLFVKKAALSAAGAAAAFTQGKAAAQETSAAAGTVPEEIPAAEDIPVREEVPAAVEEAAVEAAPVTEEISAAEEPAVEVNPAVEEESVIETIPAAEEEPAVEAIPAAEEEPVVEAIPVAEEEPAVEAIPVAEEAAEEIPAAEESPAKDAGGAAEGGNDGNGGGGAEPPAGGDNEKKRILPLILLALLAIGIVTAAGVLLSGRGKQNGTTAASETIAPDTTSGSPATTAPEPSTTAKATTAVPTTTAKDTTAAPDTTEAETTTEKATTEAPTTTAKTTTEAPTTTAEPTTEAPTTTAEPTTEAPPTTAEPTTEAPTTQAKELNPFYYLAQAKIGDVIRFGSYDQDGAAGKEPIEWIVISKSGSRILVISRVCFMTSVYSTKTPAVWATSDARSLLNGSFLNSAFTAAERANIVPRTISTPANPQSKVAGGPDTTDSVFLLSIQEIQQCLKSSQIATTATPTAQGAYVVGGQVFWWTRSPGESTKTVAHTRNGGAIDFAGETASTRGALRPAMWLNADQEEYLP